MLLRRLPFFVFPKIEAPVSTYLRSPFVSFHLINGFLAENNIRTATAKADATASIAVVQRYHRRFNARRASDSHVKSVRRQRPYLWRRNLLCECKNVRAESGWSGLQCSASVSSQYAYERAVNRLNAAQRYLSVRLDGCVSIRCTPFNLSALFGRCCPSRCAPKRTKRQDRLGRGKIN